jgi:hypothetical protein
MSCSFGYQRNNLCISLNGFSPLFVCILTSKILEWWQICPGRGQEKLFSVIVPHRLPGLRGDLWVVVLSLFLVCSTASSKSTYFFRIISHVEYLEPNFETQGKLYAFNIFGGFNFYFFHRIIFWSLSQVNPDKGPSMIWQVEFNNPSRFTTNTPNRLGRFPLIFKDFPIVSVLADGLTCGA